MLLKIAPKPDEVRANKFWRSSHVPELGLVPKLSFPLRVYCLECESPHGEVGPRYYVGIAKADLVEQRIRDHFKRKGAEYTKALAPKAIHLLWPAANYAVEAYVFNSLLEIMPRNSVHKLGGWTQTALDPTPIQRMGYERDRRALQQLCFNCGGRCWSKHCKKPVEGIPYNCPGCGTAVAITERGQSMLAQSQNEIRSGSRGNGGGSSGSAKQTHMPKQKEPTMILRQVARATLVQSASSAGSMIDVASTASRGQKRKAPDSESEANKTFACIWPAVRKQPRRGRQEELGSLADLLSMIKTKRSKSAYHDVGGRIPAWVRKFGWIEDRHYVKCVEEFRSRTGGGNSGVGLVKEAAEQIYQWCSAT